MFALRCLPQIWCYPPKKMEDRSFKRFKEIMCRHQFLVHVPSQGIILMIGARDRLKRERKANYSVVNVGLWRYDIAEDQWTDMGVSDDIMSEITNCALILTSNEEFVIILSYPIKILDIRQEHNYLIWDSGIVPPLTDHCLVARSGGSSQFVTYGFVRKLFASEEFREHQAPPTDIVDMIASFCSQEMIHWLANGLSAKDFKAGLEHKMIPLTVILGGESLEYSESTTDESMDPFLWI